MRPYEVESTRVLRRTVPVAMLAGAAALALLLLWMLLPRASEGAGPFYGAEPTFKISINYDGACDAGTLQDAVSSGASLPLTVDVSGDISGCIGTETAPGTVLIGAELFDYANVWTTTRATRTNATQAVSAAANVPFDVFVNTTANAPDMGQLRIGGEVLAYGSKSSTSFNVTARALNGTEASQHNIGAEVAAGREVASSQSPPFSLYVSNCLDSEFPNSTHDLYVGTELMTYTSKTCDGISGNPDFFSITNRTAPSDQHLVTTFVRAQGKLRLTDRQQPNYLDGTTSPPGTQLESHSMGAEIGSPRTYQTCRARLEQSGNNITLRSRCYAILEPGYSPPSQLPWPDPLPIAAPRLALIPFIHHEITRGTINPVTGLVTLNTEFLGFTCFPFITDELWIKVEQTIDLDKTIGNTDTGSFLIKVYDDSSCTNQVDELGEPLNLTAEELPTGHDTDGDACSDYEELSANQFTGGKRDPFNQWDYQDFNKDGFINIPDDILPTAASFGPVPPDHPTDVGPLAPAADGQSAETAGPFGGPGPEVWNKNRADGVVNIPHDILGVAFQFGHNCG